MKNKFTRLKQIRVEIHGMSREQLAQKSGVSPHTIKALEEGINDYRHIKLSTLIALCEGLDTKLINLFPEYKEWII